MVLEIWFAIKAFKNGWRWRVLAPCGIGFATAVLAGMAVAAGGGSPVDARPILLLVDVGLVVALGVMARRAPEAAAAPSSTGAAQAAPIRNGRADEAA